MDESMDMKVPLKSGSHPLRILSPYPDRSDCSGGVHSPTAPVLALIRCVLYLATSYRPIYKHAENATNVKKLTKDRISDVVACPGR